MNAFARAKTVEERSMNILRPVIQQRAYNGQYVVTSKGRLARQLQMTMGDLFFNSDAETIWSVEVKAEESDKHGNFFLETWSNLKWFKQGWIYTLDTDLLLYHFINEDRLYPIHFGKLRRWAFIERRLYDFPEKPQGKYEQLNDTWGRCVPINILCAELNVGQPVRPIAELGFAEVVP